MAGRALLAGYHRYMILKWPWKWCLKSLFLMLLWPVERSKLQQVLRYAWSSHLSLDHDSSRIAWGVRTYQTRWVHKINHSTDLPIWQVSLLWCTCQISMWYSIGKKCFEISEKKGKYHNGRNWLCNPNQWTDDYRSYNSILTQATCADNKHNLKHC